MVEHPHDASDPSSADGPAVVAPPSLNGDQGDLRRDLPPPRTADRDDAGVEGLLGEIRARQEKAQPIVGHWMLSSSTIALGRLDTYAACLSQMDVRALLAMVDELHVKVAALTKDRADATRAPVTGDQGYLRRERPPPRTADDIAALTIDRDDARAALYRAHDDMGKMREDCAALRAENQVLVRERDALKEEVAALQNGIAQLTNYRDAYERLVGEAEEAERRR